MAELYTTLGPYQRDELGLILPHEHVFVDLGPVEERNWADADPADVVEKMAPELEAAADAGVTALVEATPEGVGRRVDVDLAVSEAAGLPVAVPTGIYQEPNVPAWAYDADVEEIAAWMVDELTDGVGETGVRAAWIKVSASDDGPMTPVEERILRAAARASAETGAAVGSHTLSGETVRRQLDALEEEGADPGRFVWIHAQAADEEVHHAVAGRGAYVEYDWIGGDPADRYYVDRVRAMVEDGHADRVLLSTDRGWYDPSEPGGGSVDSYTYLPETFLPALRETLDEAAVRRLTHDNPFDAYAR